MCGSSTSVCGVFSELVMTSSLVLKLVVPVAAMAMSVSKKLVYHHFNSQLLSQLNFKTARIKMCPKIHKGPPRVETRNLGLAYLGINSHPKLDYYDYKD